MEKFILLFFSLLLIGGCSEKVELGEEIELTTEEDENQTLDQSTSPNVQEDWTVYVDGDEIVTNQLKCNDTTGKEIPLHLIEICNYYYTVEPLSEEQKEILYQLTGSLAARQAFHSNTPLGHEGFGEGLEEYGEFLLFNYFYWRTEVKPNSKGEFKALKFTKDFDEFFKLDTDTVEIQYEPTGPNNGVAFDTLLEAIEFEMKVVSRMKNLNLEEPFNTWSD